MCMSSLLLLSVLLTGLVCTVQAKRVVVNNGDQEQNEVEVGTSVRKLPGLCWACKWTLNKVKKHVGDNATVEKLKSTLMSICDQIGLLKAQCRGFIKKHLEVLIEELTTTDNVRTICVNVKACKPKELPKESFYQSDEDFQNPAEVFSGSYMEEE